MLQPSVVGAGVDNPTFTCGALAPCVWSKDKRFKRIGENADDFAAKGGFGTVFQGFDELTQQNVFIKRQENGSPAAARETACFNLLEAFRHPNIIAMMGTWTATYNDKEYLYIAMEACSTTLWHFIGVANPLTARKFRPAGGPEAIHLAVVGAVEHLHDRGVTHGDVSLFNILINSSGVPKLADFGTATAHTYLTGDPMCVCEVYSPS